MGKSELPLVWESDLPMYTRRQRYLLRLEKRAKFLYGNDACQICGDDFKLTNCIAVTTVCDHAFCPKCWNDYTRFKKMELLNEATDSDASEQIVQTLLTHFAGPPCPACRRMMPVVHHFAANTMTPKFETRLGINLPKDIPLRMAQHKE